MLCIFGCVCIVTNLDLCDRDACFTADDPQKLAVGVGRLSEVTLHCLQLLSGVGSAGSLLLWLILIFLFCTVERERERLNNIVQTGEKNCKQERKENSPRYSCWSEEAELVLEAVLAGSSAGLEVLSVDLVPVDLFPGGLGVSPAELKSLAARAAPRVWREMFERKTSSSSAAASSSKVLSGWYKLSASLETLHRFVPLFPFLLLFLLGGRFSVVGAAAASSSLEGMSDGG